MNNDFNQKIKKFMRTSYHEDKRLENIYNQKLSNKYTVNSCFKNNNDIHDFLYIKNKNNKQNMKNDSNKNIYNIYNNNSINRKNDHISLYKKYKKYNSIYDGHKSNICKNILDEYNNSKNSSHIINNFSLSSKIKNQKISHNNRNILLTKLAMNKLYNNFSQNKRKQNKSNSKSSFNENAEFSGYSNINKEKFTPSRVENRIIQKIQLIENENKENKVKNLLINRPPRVLNNDVFKFDTSDYSYFLPTTRYKDKNVKSIKNLKKYKSNNLFNLDNLNDIIFSIKKAKLLSTRNKGKNINI